MYSPKRTKTTPSLDDYDRMHQYVLLAAAMILCVSIEKLLSLASISTSSSKSTDSDNHDVSSDSSSNEHSEDYTPLDSSGSEKGSKSSRNLLLESPQTNATSMGNSNFTSSYDQSDIGILPEPLGNENTKQMRVDSAIDLFAPTEPYLTPPESQSSFNASDLSTMYMPDNIWPEQPPVNDLFLQSYEPQLAENNEHIILPVANQVELTNFPLPGYGVSPPFYTSQSYQNFERHAYENVDWNVTTADATTTAIDLLGTTQSDQSEPIYSKQTSVEEKVAPTNGSSKGKRRGPFQAVEQRKETGLTRKLKACIRCNMHRIRCTPDPLDPSGCCRTCIQASQTWTRWLPCLRYRITDTELLDHDVCPRPTWTSRWKKMELVDITNWDSDVVKSINVTQGVENTSYTLNVRKFKPMDSDALCRRWKIDGNQYSYECTPYAVPNMREAGETLLEFAECTLPKAIKFWVDNKDPLLCSTYNMAYNYSLHAEREEDRSLLQETLRLWSASRMMSRGARICGKETLGMKAKDYGPKSTSTGKILMPPVFSAQMEVIFVAMILQPAKKKVLSQLKTLIQEGSRRSWLAIYLSIFLLLHSCALLTARDHERARSQGVQRRFYRPRLIDELHYGAKILLGHFHFCNKGSYPLHMDWTSADQIALTELKPMQIEFMRNTAKDFEKKAPHFRSILEEGKYEDEFYFIAQLYERDWKPRQTV